jgi:hypothetical protein
VLKTRASLRNKLNNKESSKNSFDEDESLTREQKEMNAKIREERLD